MAAPPSGLTGALAFVTPSRSGSTRPLNRHFDDNKPDRILTRVL